MGSAITASLADHLQAQFRYVSLKEGVVEASCIRTTRYLTEPPVELSIKLAKDYKSIHSKDKTHLFVPYHRLSFLVKDGYFVLLLASIGGRYVGKTSVVKTSGLTMTNDFPFGSHVTTSVKEESSRIDMSRCGKISLLLQGTSAAACKSGTVLAAPAV